MKANGVGLQKSLVTFRAQGKNEQTRRSSEQMSERKEGDERKLVEIEKISS